MVTSPENSFISPWYGIRCFMNIIKLKLFVMTIRDTGKDLLQEEQTLVYSESSLCVNRVFVFEIPVTNLYL